VSPWRPLRGQLRGPDFASTPLYAPPPCCGERVRPGAPVGACRWGFIDPCRPTVSKVPPSNDGWVHEVKHDCYRLQIHVGKVACRHMGEARTTGA
jgi:hypothetical protein